MAMSALFFALSVFLELSLHAWFPVSRRLRLALAASASAAMLVSAGLLLLDVMDGWQLLPALFFIILYLYRSFNAARIIKGRMHPAYLRSATLRTSTWLIGVQTLIGGLLILPTDRQIPLDTVLLVAISLELALAAVIYASAKRYSSSLGRQKNVQSLSSSQLPSVSVAVPARNETDSLQQCIESLIASDYPKLEILVLDDCSRTARTPEIIRGYANKGVRFIQGQEPRTNWLAKNQAYQALSQTASGELLLFTGVDIRFEPDAIRRIVTRFETDRLSMLSLLPKNNLPKHVSLLQPMRYFLEIAVLGGIFGRPPVLSSCWLIRASALQKAGGFQAVSRMIIPESYFAKHLNARKQYAFLAGRNYGIGSVKKLARQRDTAVRISYPRLRRRPENVAAISLALAAGLALPLAIMIAGVLEAEASRQTVLAGAVLLLLLLAYRSVLMSAYGRARLFDVAALPLAVIVQLGLLHYSMYKYEFDEVVWKGRNVCVPVMHVIPRLPNF